MRKATSSPWNEQGGLLQELAGSLAGCIIDRWSSCVWALQSFEILVIPQARPEATISKDFDRNVGNTTSSVTCEAVCPVQVYTCRTILLNESLVLPL